MHSANDSGAQPQGDEQEIPCEGDLRGDGVNLEASSRLETMDKKSDRSDFNEIDRKEKSRLGSVMQFYSTHYRAFPREIARESERMQTNQPLGSLFKSNAHFKITVSSPKLHPGLSSGARQLDNCVHFGPSN
jgi:hypothetical protein